MGSTLLHQGLCGLGQSGFTQLQIGAPHLPIGVPLGNARGNGRNGGTPKRVPRTVGKENDG